MLFYLLRRAAAHANSHLGVITSETCELISRACKEIESGSLDSHFPIRVWQTGSGTHSNMNMNEVQYLQLAAFTMKGN